MFWFGLWLEVDRVHWLSLVSLSAVDGFDWFWFFDDDVDGFIVSLWYSENWIYVRDGKCDSPVFLRPSCIKPTRESLPSYRGQFTILHH